VEDKEFRRLVKIREQCEICGGIGYVETARSTGGLRLDDCICIKKLKYELRLIESNIPIPYRKFTFKQLTPTFLSDNKKAFGVVKKYIENMDENIRHGRGLWFYSLPGLAKSSIISNILRKALKKKYTVYFERASHLVTLKFQAMRHEEDAKDKLRHILSNVHVLAIEEIEKVYLAEYTSMPNQHFYEFLSDVYDANVSLLISSNKLRSEYEKTLPHFIQDRFKSLKSIPLTGKSGRRDHRKP